MNHTERMRDFKILVGQFHEQMHSNSVTDLLSWIDCKLELDGKLRTEQIRRR